MDYLNFRERWLAMGCFNVRQILAWCPDFYVHNLTNWAKKGYLVKLRKVYYAFAECKSIPEFSRYIANRIYMPSYISLHTALSYYGMIPESVVQITSISSLKTARFANEFGEFSYNSVKPELMYGYEPKSMADGRAILFATPEKALFDLLYLNQYYQSMSDMLELRLDEDFMCDEFNLTRFKEYCEISHNQALQRRAKILLKAYDL